jgi:ABC-type antimicrobial peptide transport system permease subunit
LAFGWRSAHRAADVARAVILQAGRFGLFGSMIGGSAALGVSYVVAAIVEVMPPIGLTPLAVAGAIVIGASLIAAAIPSLRAGRVDPPAALRSE